MAHNQFDQSGTIFKFRPQPHLKFYQGIRAFTVSGDEKKSSRKTKERCRSFNFCPPYFPLLGKIRRGGRSIS
jgi:hypothetical protein